jgi:hypothetical protein
LELVIGVGVDLKKPLTHLSTPPQMLRDVLIQNAAHHFEQRISSR